jgi:hypothetical protein
MLPLLILVFFQWSLRDNWLSTFISVFTLLLFLSAFAYPTYFIFRAVLEHGSTVFKETMQQRTFEALIGPFRTQRYYFFISALLVPFIRACFISLVKENGFIQVIGLVVLEVLYLCSLIFLRPGHTRRSDVLEIFLGLVRVITTAALLPFVREKLAVTAIPRVAVGIGIAVVICVGVVVIFINVLLDLLPWKMVWQKLRGQKEEVESNDLSEDLEKNGHKNDESPKSMMLEDQDNPVVTTLPSTTAPLAEQPTI